jgi:phosphoglycolate phosphatase-like HAD superfamily hydrolase
MPKGRFESPHRIGHCTRDAEFVSSQNTKCLLKAIERLGSLPSGSLYVGDIVTDAETAKRAELLFVAVLSGVTLREDFRN